MNLSITFFDRVRGVGFAQAQAKLTERTEAQGVVSGGRPEQEWWPSRGNMQIDALAIHVVVDITFDMV